MSTGNKPYFTIDEGNPIAVIYNSRHKDKYIGIDYEEPSEAPDFEDELEMVSDLLAYDVESRRQLSDKEQQILEDSIYEREAPTDKKLKKIYNECIERLDTNINTSIRLPSGIIQPIPTASDDQTDRLYVVGPSGSGKSTFIAMWCTVYSELYPENRIFLFSRKLKDKNIDVIPNLIRVELDKTFEAWLYKPEAEQPIIEPIETIITPNEKDKPIIEPIEPIITAISAETSRKPRKNEILKRHAEQEHKKGLERKDFLDELEYSVCIFDDIDVIGNNVIREEVRKLRDDLLETGRDRDITVIATSHQINNYNLTRKLINEATAVVLFPHSGASDQVKLFLKNRMSLTNEQIKSIMTLPTRWLYIYKNSPRYIIHEHGAIFI